MIDVTQLIESGLENFIGDKLTMDITSLTEAGITTEQLDDLVALFEKSDSENIKSLTPQVKEWVEKLKQEMNKEPQINVVDAGTVVMQMNTSAM